MTASQYKQRLKLAAKLMSNELKRFCRTTPLRLRRSLLLTPTDTAGWSISIAGLGRGQPELELWLDRYAGQSEPTFWYGFYSPEHQLLKPLIQATPPELRAERILEGPDVTTGRVGRLVVPLKRGNFNKALEERYPNWGTFFFGFYEPQRDFGNTELRQLASRAASLVGNAVQGLRSAKAPQEGDEAFPRWENRRIVRIHVRRERDPAISAACKERDGYRCQICGQGSHNFDGWGISILESHHIVPLSKLSKAVLRGPEDLITVCANCHKMLHQMDGKPEDIDILRGIVAKEKRKQKRS